MPANNAIYLDSNAGAPVHPKVAEALLPFLIGKRAIPSNPSSSHSHGRDSRRWIQDALEQISESLGMQALPGECLLVSSGTEANQTAIRAALEPLFDQGLKPHWITTRVEHDSVLQMVKWVEQRGGEVDYLPVDPMGRPLPGALDSLWRPETALVSVIWVNNETGVISPVQEIAAKVKARHGALHLDGAQAWGKIPVDLSQLHADWVSFSGHKIGALSGSGVLWVSQARLARFAPLLAGKQQKGRRGGTENLLGAIALGAAAKCLNASEYDQRLRPLRDRLESELLSRIPGTWVNGREADRVANTISLTIEGVEASSLITALDLKGFSVSAGSACASGTLEPSHVLLALGLTQAQARSSLRVSLVPDQEWEGLAAFAEALAQTVERMRNSRVRREPLSRKDEPLELAN